MSLNIERSNLSSRPKGNSKFEIRNSECENQSREVGMRNSEIKVGKSKFEIRNAECENQVRECGMRNAKFGIRNAEIKGGNSKFGFGIWDFSLPTIVGLVLLSSFSAIGQQPTDAKVEPRVPRAEFVAPPSASSAAALGAGAGWLD